VRVSRYLDAEPRLQRFIVAMKALIILLCSLVMAAAGRPAFAHCDTYDGPVVKAGQKSLATGDLDAALIWIKPAQELELRAAFKQAITVRALGSDARELADRYFLETLVRLHRAGEGMPFTGIKPKGTDIGVAIPAADASIASGSPRALTKLVTDAAQGGIQERLARVRARRTFKPHDVAAGREYVEAYVAFTHYVEELYATASGHESEHAAANERAVQACFAQR
jgi:hypothetical protein